MRHLRRLAVAALAALALTACGGSTPAPAPATAPAPSPAAIKGPIKIGAVLVTSGQNAAYGISQRAGIQQAMDDINKAGGANGAQIQVMFEDSAGDKAQATNAVKKLIDKDEVTAILGPTLSTEMFAAGPVAQQAGVPILGISTTAKGITDIGDFVFRCSLPESGVLPTTVKRSVDKFQLKKVGLIFDNADDFSRSGAEIFTAELQKNHVEIVATEKYVTQDADYNAQLTNILAKNPDGLVVSGLYGNAANIIIQVRAKGFKGPIIGGNGFNSPKLAEIAKEAAEGTVVGSPWFSGSSAPTAKAFVDAFKGRNDGKTPDQFAAQAYDGLSLLAKAIATAGSTDRTKVRDALAGIKDFSGVTGTISFDAQRNPVAEPFILQINGGKYVELK